jgi:hypothetical protein
MPVKQRTPKGREFKVTPEVIDLFSRGRALQKRIDGLEDKLRDVRRELHRLCGLAPWEQDVLDVLDPQPWPRTGNLHDESGPKVIAIKRAIEAAMQERGKKAAGAAEGGGGDGRA